MANQISIPSGIFDQRNNRMSPKKAKKKTKKAKAKKNVIVKPIHLFHLDSIVPPDLVWDLIVRPFYSIKDLSRLDCAIAVKTTRKIYLSKFEQNKEASVKCN
jgi:hypothetical protein